MHALVQSGLTLQETGAQFGLSRQRVQQVLGEHGYPTRRPPQGIVCATCGQRYPRGDSKAHRATPEHRRMISRPGQTEKFPERNQDIVRRYLAGERTQDIAERYGIVQPSIYTIVRRHGVKPDRGGGQYARDGISRDRLSASLRRRHKTDERTEIVARLTAEGLSSRKIAAILNVAPTTVVKARNRARERRLPPYDTYPT
jgi:DNA-binding CsgD family transcriptional regulator